MADVTKLVKRNPGNVVYSDDHNSVVDAIVALNQEVNKVATSDSTYAQKFNTDDDGWSGSKVGCHVNEFTGVLQANARATYGSQTGGEGVWDPDWEPIFTYRSNVIDFGGLLHCDVVVIAHGLFTAADPAVKAQWSVDGSNWYDAQGAQIGQTFYSTRTKLRYLRFEIDVETAGYDASYLSGFTFSVKGPRYGEDHEQMFSVGWNVFEFTKHYVQPPIVRVTPLWNAEQDVVARVRNVTKESFEASFVLLNDVNTSVNALASVEVKSR